MVSSSNSSSSPSVARWREMLSRCLEALEREQVGSPCPVVDHEIVSPPAGGPEDFTVWFVCRNQAERSLFRDSEQPRFIAALAKKLVAAGWPETAIASLTVRVTSRDELAQNGGRFSSR